VKHAMTTLSHDIDQGLHLDKYKLLCYTTRECLTHEKFGYFAK